MRIVAGKFRGLALASVGKGDPAAHLRPTTDRVRESLFNILMGGKFDDPITDAMVLDLCAGTGALGLEALSRGAKGVTFVDSGRKAIALIRQNIEKTHASQATVVQQRDVLRLGPSATAHELVFIDPPYGQQMTPKVLAAAAANGWISKGALVVSEDEGTTRPVPGFTPLDSRRFGNSTISFLRFDS